MDSDSLNLSIVRDASVSIEKYLETLSPGQNPDDTNIQRISLLSKARALVSALETPLESILRIAWAEPTRTAAIRVAIDLKLFETLSKDLEPKTLEQLANVGGVDTNFLSRLLKHLASMSVIEEVQSNTYKSTPLSEALTVPKYRDSITFCAEATGPVFQKIPAFLANANYKEPTDPTAGPFQFGQDTSLRMFEWRKERPHIQTAFNNHMAGYAQDRPYWADPGFYPLAERLLPNIQKNPEAVAIVDLGGSIGHDLRKLKTKHPDLPGRFILQDLPQVIEQTKDLPAGIEATVHDFRTAQPVKGARIYFMHSVLHDWPDEECKVILRHTATAMEKGYSRLLINENVVPDVGASWQITSLDWFMMALAAARERTERQWRMMLESAGFRVVGIWKKEGGVESLIEAVLKEEEVV